ncbi:MAG: hypothetical protein AAGE76_12810 [Pseudomonadota bacterium]
MVIVDIIIKQENRPVPSGGLITIHRIKSHAKECGRTVRAIAISGAVVNPGLEDILKTAKLMGTDAVLEKPFRPKQHLDVVDRMLETQ